MSKLQRRNMVDTYLDFGLIKSGKKIPRDSRTGQEAYDLFMIARYLKDLISYHEGEIENIYHYEDLEDNLRKYCAFLACASPNAIYYEIGSTLMGVIDALEYINSKYNELNIKDITFVGVDISSMMNYLAVLIHGQYKVETSTSKKIVSADLFFAKGSSLLYAFNQEEEFCNILKNCRLCIFDYSFSLLDVVIKDFVSTGKPVTFLSKNKCKLLLEDQNKTLVLTPSLRDIKKRDNIVSMECIYGDSEVVDGYIKELERKNICTDYTERTK